MRGLRLIAALLVAAFLAVPSALAATVAFRAAAHDGYGRLVFEWSSPVGHKAAIEGNRLVVDFNEPAAGDPARLAAHLSGYLKGGHSEDGGRRLVFDLAGDFRLKSQAFGSTVVLDLVKTAAATAPAKPAKKPASRSAAAEKSATPPEGAAQPAGEAGGRIVSLSFPWDQPTGAAVFRRSGYLWVVFDRSHSVDLKLLRRLGKGVVLDIEQVRSSRGTALRLVVADGYAPSLRREGLLWIVDLMPGTMRPLRALEVVPQAKAEGGARLTIPLSEGGVPISLTDPEIGDTLLVVPVIPLGHGISPGLRYVDALLPVTAQGVVVVPLSDGVEVASDRNGINVTRKGGLRLSGDTTAALALATTQTPAGGNIFDFPKWQRGGEASFVADQRALMQAIVDAADEKRNAARTELARFYFAHGYGAETLGVLRTILLSDKGVEAQPGFRALRGGANFLMYRYAEALEDLKQESLDGYADARLWRSLARVSLPGTPDAADVLLLRGSGAVFKDMPPYLRTRLALAVANVLAAANDDAGVRNFLDIAKRDDLTPQETAEITYLTGRMDAAAGALDAAIAEWRKAEDMNVRPFRAKSAFARVMLMRKMGKTSDAEAIEELERLRFAWRGDEFEWNLLKTLADLDFSAKRYGEGLRVLKQMAAYFRNKPEARAIAEEMRSIFRELYLKDRADEMPPVRAIGLFEEFRELTPPGDEGNEMIRKLADRLVAVDLLDQAASLLAGQIATRLTGEAKAKVGARLALVYLLNRQPGNAMDALKKSEVPGIPHALAVQRLHLMVRSLADLGQTGKAVALLDPAGDDDSNRIKAEILWHQQDWAGAADALARTIHPPAPGTQMDPAMRQRLLQWVTALRLSDQRQIIGLVRRDYLGFMNSTPEFDAFNLLTNNTGSGLIDLASVEAQIKQAENFRSFMGDYKSKVKAGGLSAIN